MVIFLEEYKDEFVSRVFKSITADNGTESAKLSELEAYGVAV